MSLSASRRQLFAISISVVVSWCQAIAYVHGIRDIRVGHGGLSLWYDELIDFNSGMLEVSMCRRTYHMPTISGPLGVKFNAVGPSALVPQLSDHG